MERIERSVSAMYGEEDLAETAMFRGGFINFGYWPELPNGTISEEERIESARRLYREALKRLGIQDGDSILEVGCGRGHGCALALREFHPGRVTGLDASEQQIARAKKIHAGTLASGKLAFLQGLAEEIPLRDGAVDRLYSVEAAQHFQSVPKFLEQAFRVLKPGGAMAVTTFFATDLNSLDALSKALPTVRDGIDRVVPAAQFVSEASRCGFHEIRKESIGDRVFEGFDRWLAQTESRDSWGRAWLRLFREGRLDYLLITARHGGNSRWKQPMALTKRVL